VCSPTVRKWFRDELGVRLPEYSYFDTINSTPDRKELPPLWLTLEFSGASDQRISLGSPSCWREYGEVQIVVLGKSGKSDEDVLIAAEAVRMAFFDVAESVPLTVGTGHLKFSADVPNTDTTENGNWFFASVSCAYTFDTVK
jgi:hypothetical protein